MFNIDKVINQMTLDEKIDFCIGKDEWYTKELPHINIESIMVSDGPHGLRCQKNINNYKSIDRALPATCFPTAVTASNTWDKDLIKEEGKAIGEEAREYKVSVVLGPGANIKRNPLCGRNFEYFSEDPILAGEMASSFINGVQSTGVGTSLKHFALNNQEYSRMYSNSIVDKRTMHEIYLKPFEIAVKKANPYTIMCSYNLINGTHASDNKHLLTDILRNKWGYKGMVVSDWGAIYSQIEAFKAGCDLNMPGGHSYMHNAVKNAIKNNELSINDIDTSVKRILELVKKTYNLKEKPFNKKKHHELAIKIASSGAVLLKNDNVLPLDLNDICLFGNMAKNIRYQGAGSSHINPTKLQNPIDLINAPYLEAVNNKGELINNIEEIKEFAKKKNKSVIICGLPDCYESEGFDRENMKMPKGHLDLIEAVSSVNKNTIVIIISGSPVEVPFENKVKGIIYMGLPGQGGAEAIRDILTGKVNPSGKLSETWPISYNDVITKDIYAKRNPRYEEGIFVGYRYYDKAKLNVRYPFGYGLSYSTFEYSNLKIKNNKVSLKIKNTSNIKGSEVVQLYVSPKNNNYRANRELKDFIKISLNPKESKTITFELIDDYFTIYDNDNFIIIKDKYKIEIGSSSRDIKLIQQINVNGSKINFSNLKNTWYEHPTKKLVHKDFEKLYGQKIKEDKLHHRGNYTLDDTVYDMAQESWILKIFLKIIINNMNKGFKKEERTLDNPGYRMMHKCVLDNPLRGSELFAAGLIDDSIILGLLDIANKKYLNGINKIIRKIS